MTIKRFMLARAVAADAIPRSAAKSPRTFVVGLRPPPFGRRRSVRGFAPILISFSFKLVSDQSLIGSGVASVRRKLPKIIGERMKLESHGVGGERFGTTIAST